MLLFRLLLRRRCLLRAFDDYAFLMPTRCRRRLHARRLLLYAAPLMPYADATLFRCLPPPPRLRVFITPYADILRSAFHAIAAILLLILALLTIMRRFVFCYHIVISPLFHFILRAYFAMMPLYLRRFD